jgi:aldehyde dehydrogenase (NAD+)
VTKAQKFAYGDPLDEKNLMGTLIDEQAAIRVQNRVQSAIKEGAKLLCGDLREGALYSPTVIQQISPQMNLVKEETFGPVAPIIVFHNLEEAISLANDTPYGLSSGVCTNRMDYAFRFIHGLECGTVNINEVPGYRLEDSPFGGIKDSGLGHKEGIREAAKLYTNVKTYSLLWDSM